MSTVHHLSFLNNNDTLRHRRQHPCSMNTIAWSKTTTYIPMSIKRKPCKHWNDYGKNYCRTIYHREVSFRPRQPSDPVMPLEEWPTGLGGITAATDNRPQKNRRRNRPIPILPTTPLPEASTCTAAWEVAKPCS